MKKNSIGLPVIGAMAIAMGLGGCADENPWSNAGSETGSINLTLTTDYEFDTAKPVFRSGEGETGETRATADLKSIKGIIVPSKDNFSIKLENKEGTVSKTWTTLADFEKYAKGNPFTVGLYTLTASYGKETDEGFNKPFFEAETSFNILAGRTRDINLTAELKNSLVQIEYTESFKNYMQAYTAYISTGGSSEVKFESSETRPAYIQPGTATLSLDFTTKVTDKNAVKLQIGTFEAIPKTLHKITLDVTPNDNGATLTVIFDETVNDGDDVNIDLTQDLYSRPAPTITSTGFNNGETIDMKENAANVALRMDIFAPDGIKSAKLIAKGTSGYDYNQEIDLISSTAPDGIIKTNFPTTVTNLGEGEKPEKTTASLDITNYAKALCQSTEVKEYTLTLTVTDYYDKESEPMRVILNTEDLSMSHLPLAESSASEVTFGSNSATLKLAYNGADPQNVVFVDEEGNQATIEQISYNGEVVSSRALETKVYEYTLLLPSNCYSNKVILKAYDKNKYNAASTSEEKEAVRLGTFNDISVSAPEYTISVDAFAKYAFLRINTNDAKAREYLTQHISITNNENAVSIANDRNANTGIIAITGLTPNQEYATLKSKITGWDEETTVPEFTTETAETIPNGDFTQARTDKKLDSGTLYVGGKFIDRAGHEPQATSSYLFDLPKDWGTINDKTTKASLTNNNTWFRVPSSWVDNGIGILRNVGYHESGLNIKTAGSGWKPIYYCNNAPDNAQTELSRAAGELFLESEFNSRPSSISITYEYTPYGEDSGFGDIKISDSNGNSIATVESLSVTKTNGFITKELKIQYLNASKASNIYIKFKSSNQTNTANIPINIPSGDDLNENLSYSTKGTYTVAQNQYHALATGSVLKIDNVTANYDYPRTNANAAPKRRQTTKKK